MRVAFKGREWDMIRHGRGFCEGCDLLKTQGDACNRTDHAPCTKGDGRYVLRATPTEKGGA